MAEPTPAAHMASTISPSPDVLAAVDASALRAEGFRRLEQGRWDEAAACLQRALDEDAPVGIDRARLLEGLGYTRYWLEDGPAAISAHEGALEEYRRLSRSADAARMALWLADDYLSLLGAPSVAGGWLAQAERLADDAGETPEWAWLPIYRAHYLLQVDHDPVGALALAEEGFARARLVGVPEVEVVALAVQGLSFVLMGEVEPGLRKLDEASATAVARGTSNLYAAAWALCYQIQGCDSIRDFARAAEWCDRVFEFCERWGLGSLFTACRIRYASVLTWQGQWAAAEAQVDALIGANAEGAPRPSRRTGLIRLADIRRRQGSLDEAEALFDEGGEHRWAVLGRAAIALDRGDLEVAADLSARVLRRLPEDVRADRADALLIQVRALAGQRATEEASPLLEELGDVARRLATEPVRGAAEHARGAFAVADRRPSDALAHMERALVHYEKGGAPHEAATVRLELAGVLRALGRDATARREAARSRDAFQALGARGDLARADAFLARLGLRGRADGSDLPLSDRELEVLRLVGRGLSNPEIAAELFLSPHTVKRHIANILRKMGCSTRAEAVAHGSRAGVV